MRSASIRVRLLLLVLAATLPLTLFSAALLERAYNGSTALIEDTAMSNVRQIALALDAHISRAEAVVAGLAELPLLDSGDSAAFETVATRALAAAGIEAVPVLATADGGVAAPDPAGLRRTFEEAKPQISGLIMDASAAEAPFVVLHTPLFRNGFVAYDAMLKLPAESVSKLLAVQTLPENWFASIADREGRIIARTRNAAARVGQPISPSLAELAGTQDQGFSPNISREGSPIYSGFAHSAASGWLVAVAVPARSVRGPLLRSVTVLAAGTATILVVSLVLAWLIGRGISVPLKELTQEAARLGQGGLPNTDKVTGFFEVEQAGEALGQAGALLIARDQEREAALRRAEESEERLLMAQEVGEIGVWQTDCLTGRRTWSQQQYKLYGVDSRHEPPHGDGWSKLIHADDRPRVLATVARAYSQPMRYQHEFRIIQPGGALRWIRSAGVSLFRDTQPFRLIGITIDTTDRHEAERILRDGAARLEADVAARTRELAESESRFRIYFEHSAEALMVVRVEPGGRFVFETMNKSGERLTGTRARDIAGKTPEDALLPETAASVLETYRRVTSKPGTLQLEQMLTFASGTLEVETVLVPVFGPDGKVARIIIGHRDLSERRRIEGRLSHAQRLEAVGQLTGGVAHDFNNLLTVIIGNLALLRRRLGEDERAARYLGSVETAAERAAKLTASLLAFSRRQTLLVAPLDVGAQLQESTTLLRRALGEEIELTLDIAPGLPLARADAAQLEAAVLNLAINARDAIHQAMRERGVRGGSLRISVQPAVLLASDLEGNDEAQPGRFIAVQVQDTGIGMAPNVRARAFEPFFTTKEVGQGTGLGLSQVFGFARQLGGHVTLESTPGYGTRVVIYLPEAPVGPLVAADAAGSPTQLPQGATVLVVEDDDGIRDVTAEVLGDAGLAILTAPNGPAALEILRRPARVDLLFSDVVMPGGSNGVDLARAARTLRPGLAVLLTSGYGGPALSRYGAEGEYEVLAKPYTRAVLLERIGHILAGLQPAGG